MERSTSLVDLVPLPYGSAREHVTLAQSLRSRAAAADLPDEVAPLLADVEGAQGSVEDALAASVKARPIDARAQRSGLAAAWSAQQMAVDAHLTVPDHDEPDVLAAANELQRLVYGEGLLFLAATSHEDAYGGSKTLLEVLEGPVCQADVAKLGIKLFARSIRRNHDAFGAAAGFTTAPDDEGNVAKQLEVLRRALKRYIGTVMSWHDASPVNEATADALLQPYVVWDPPGKKAARDTGEVEPVTPGLPPEPGEPTAVPPRLGHDLP
jgi:hypothetical protein